MPICKGKDRLDAFKGCGKEIQKYGNSTYKLCIRCNSKRLLDKKTPKKATGQRELFDEIWAERKQVSFLSNKRLSHYENTPFWFNLFAHVLSKALNKYPKFILHKENIILLTPEEHTLLDHGSESQREKYAEENQCDWDDIYDLKEKLKEDYERIKH